MAYIETGQHETETAHFQTMGRAAIATASNIVSSSFHTVRKQLTFRRSVAEFAGINDQILREIGVHRSEITAIAEDGAHLGRARYYN